MARRMQMGSGILAAPKGAIWWGVGGFALTSLIGFVAVANLAWTQSTFVIDEFFHAHTSSFQEWLANVLEAIDRYVVVAVILLIMGILVTLWKGWLPALGSILVAGVGWLMIAGVKEVVAEPRPMPFDGTPYQQALSYPSGHVTFVMALTVALGAILAGTRWRWPVVVFMSLLTLLTAWSRLLLGVHYPMDVVGGILGGLSGAFFVLGLWNMAVTWAVRRRTTARH